MLDTQGYKHTLTIRYNYIFSTQKLLLVASQFYVICALAYFS